MIAILNRLVCSATELFEMKKLHLAARTQSPQENLGTVSVSPPLITHHAVAPDESFLNQQVL